MTEPTVAPPAQVRVGHQREVRVDEGMPLVATACSRVWASRIPMHTKTWYAFRVSENTFGIFDTFVTCHPAPS